MMKRLFSFRRSVRTCAFWIRRIVFLALLAVTLVHLREVLLSSCVNSIPDRSTSLSSPVACPYNGTKVPRMGEGETPPLNHNPNEIRHVVYVRIPKTGSTAVSVLVWQFAWRRNLSGLYSHPYWPGTRGSLSKPWFFLPPEGTKRDVMAEHVLFNSTSFARFFHKDTFYITLLREPMSMLYSTLYYVPEFVAAVPGENKLEGYLKDPSKYDGIAIRANRSFTRNPQSSYFGLQFQDFNNLKQINNLVSSILKHFPLVMILEKMDESLVLMRRLLRWSMADIIYSDKNKNKNYKKPVLDISLKQRESHKKLSLADYRLYYFFKRKMDDTIRILGRDFLEEVNLFRKYKKEIANYCKFDAITGKPYEKAATRYHEAFQFTPQDCLLYSMGDLVLSGMLRQRQGHYPAFLPQLLDEPPIITEGAYPYIEKYGPNSKLHARKPK